MIDGSHYGARQEAHRFDGSLRPCKGAIARVKEDWEGELKKGQLVELLGPTCGNDTDWHWTVRAADAPDNEPGVSLPPELFEVVAIPCTTAECDAPAAIFIIWPGKGRVPYCATCALGAAVVLNTLGAFSGADPIRQR